MSDVDIRCLIWILGSDVDTGRLIWIFGVWCGYRVSHLDTGCMIKI